MDIVGTPVGDARIDVRPATGMAGSAKATLVIGHGAGGGIEAPDLGALADHLPGRGITVVRVESPWRVAGRRVATPPATLDRAWLGVLEHLGARGHLAGRLVLGGRSAGARVACRTASVLGAAGVLALAFPLVPPGRPDRSRLPELLRPLEAGIPLLVVQGERDAFGAPHAFPAAAPGWAYRMHPVPGADHSFRVRRADGHDQRAVLAAIAEAAAAWALDLAARRG